VSPPLRRVAGTLLVLMLLAAASLALQAFVAARTAARIDANARAFAMRQLDEIVAPGTYDNALASDVIVVRDEELLGGPGPRTIYRAYADTEPVAAVISTVAPDGYSGRIALLVGVLADGRIAGVRVTAHRETRGLGDRIELRHSDWITRFDGRSLRDPPPARWAVRANGGEFDQFTGATVTPQAVVEAARDALIYFGAHRDEIFAAPAQVPTP
jgi:electron transport complex protein RnfG